MPGRSRRSRTACYVRRTSHARRPHHTSQGVKSRHMAAAVIITPRHLRHAVTNRKDGNCDSSGTRDPKCETDWPDICPWWAYQMYRHATGDFSSPEWWEYQLGLRDGFPIKRQTRENLIRKYLGLSLATDAPSRPVIAGPAGSDPRCGDHSPAAHLQNFPPGEERGDSAAAAERRRLSRLR